MKNTLIIPNNPENMHIIEIPEEIGVWKIVHPNNPEKINRTEDHINAFLPFVSFHRRYNETTRSIIKV